MHNEIHRKLWTISWGTFHYASPLLYIFHIKNIREILSSSLQSSLVRCSREKTLFLLLNPFNIIIYNETIVIAFFPKVRKGHSAIASTASTLSIARSVNEKNIDKGRGEKSMSHKVTNYLHIWTRVVECECKCSNSLFAIPLSPSLGLISHTTLIRVCKMCKGPLFCEFIVALHNL